MAQELVLCASGEMVVLQSEGGTLPDKLFHNDSKMLDANTGDGNRSIGKIDPDGPCQKLLDYISDTLRNDGILQASALHNKANNHVDNNVHHVA
jgi:hypothetical protein